MAALSLSACAIQEYPVSDLTTGSINKADGTNRLGPPPPVAQPRPEPVHPHGWSTRLEIEGLRRNLEPAADRFEAMVNDTIARAPTVPVALPSGAKGGSAAPKMALGMDPWWRRELLKPIEGRSAARITLNDSVHRALEHSHQLRVFGRIPSIRETGVDEANGRFTPEAYAEVKKDRRNDPANNFSEALGNNRALLERKDVEVGVRSRTITGAEVALSQRYSDIDTNLSEYDPKDQDRRRTAVSIVQPLLRGGGVTYNRSIIRVAELDAEVSFAEFVRQSEGHLLEIVRSYWTIYRSRAVYLQRKRLADATRDLLGKVEARSGVDVDEVQVSRTRAALSARETDLLRTRTAIENAENRLRSLINDPGWAAAGAIEFIPTESPDSNFTPVNYKVLLQEAVDARPELIQAFAQFRASLVREGMSENEAKPQLDLILEGYRHRGSNEKLFTDETQEDHGKYGFAAGVRFAVPLWEDERQARHSRRKIETIQQEDQVRAAIATVALELDVSGSEYRVSHEELRQRATALKAAETELQTIEARWQAGRAGETGLLLLNQLVDAQERRQKAEEDLAGAEITFVVARENLFRARGGYLQRRGLQAVPAGEKEGRKIYRLEPIAHQRWNAQATNYK
ncbi:MAG: TolC family protein [Hyphomicrobium aestuarii]|nr:TolC family protein [Hyphomicrobium aestuarii]